MRDAEARAQRVAELVRGKIGHRAQTCQTVMRKAAAPHQLAHRVRVCGVCDSRWAVTDDYAQAVSYTHLCTLWQRPVICIFVCRWR